MVTPIKNDFKQMDKTNATETNASSIATKEEVKVLPLTDEDLEARNQALEEERARLMVERENYKVAYLKEKSRRDSEGEDDTTEKMRQIAQEELANSRLAEIAKEQDAIIKKALKENKELKLAQMNKTDIPASMGTHSASTPVTDTMITPEQMAAFKARGWTDKDIERYKKNMLRYGR